ncbi:MAG TPA: lytic transglycosylase domain-containing protein [Nocardioides sp.]|uniref:aggregation-promoting factor C-terminal-like domain-containing protein n=1 Tax=Nocardioides sp. TaxID=35761 RepID=UPI002BC9EB40|nr:lytic transglycosylase domain-containing protein [Nocardioides sp.]HQR26110.1 lytic transglycosylase domain-containing protein [Nocardioides sp.]
MTSVAAAATGVVVSGGVLSGDPALPAAADALSEVSADVSVPVPRLGLRPQTGTTVEQPAAREETVSRSDQRTSTDPAKAATLSTDPRPAVAHTEDLSGADPRTIAMALLPEFGFSADQFACLDPLYVGESGWRVDADNPTSSAYGIPQALPGSKMASAGADWATNPVTQIRWGLGYIAERYGTPCGAWSFKQGHGWY